MRESIARERLLRAMDGASPLLILQGPSGFGKSTLLRHWLATFDEDHRVVSLFLGPDPIPASEFWMELLTSASQAGILHPVTATAMSSAAMSGMLDLKTLAALLTTGEPCLITIDGFEHARPDHPALDEQLVELALAHPRLRIVVATRSAAQFSSDRALLRGAITVISADELTFTLDETRVVLDGIPELPAIPNLADQLHRETGGFPLALHAATAVLSKSPWLALAGSTSRQRLVSVSLESELWALTDPAFVSMTSLAPVFDSTLAATIAGIPVGMVEQILDDLEWHGFGHRHELRDGSRVFAYIPTLHDPIRRRTLADWSTERLQQIGRPAIAWLRSINDAESAFALALDVRAYDDAAATFRLLMATNPRCYHTSDFAVPLSEVPAEVYNEEPVLAFAYGLALINDPTTRRAAPAYLRMATTTARSRENPPPGAHAWELLVASISLRLLGEFNASGCVAREAMSIIRSTDSASWSSTPEANVMMVRQLTFCLAQVGDLEAAEELIAWAMASSPVTAATTDLAVTLVTVHALSGKVTEAVSLAKRYPIRDSAVSSSNPFLLELGRIAVATIHMENFDFVAGLAELREHPARSGNRELWPFRQWVTLHAHLGSGNAHEAAMATLDEAVDLGSPVGREQSIGAAALLNVVAISLLTGDEHALVRGLLNAETPFPGQTAPAVFLARMLADDSRGALETLVELGALEGHSLRSRAALHTVGAAAALREKNHELTGTLLRRAARSFDTHGMRLPLLYLPAPDMAALAEHSQLIGLDLFPGHQEVRIPSPHFSNFQTVRLSEREQAVAKAMLQHAHRDQIAEALFVSSNTIKTQLRSIYRKLGVSTRKEAIDRIVALGLVLDDSAGHSARHSRGARPSQNSRPNQGVRPSQGV